MTRAAVALCAVMVGGAVLTVRSAQVPLFKEPRHKQVLYTAHLRVLEVTIPSGDVTLDHWHEYDVATVAIEEASSRTKIGTGAWAEPRPRAIGSLNLTEYTGARGSHRIETVGTKPFRLIAVENVRDGGWTTPAAIEAPGTTLARESRAFSIYEIRLDGNTPQTQHTHEMPTVAVLISGAFSYQGGGGSDPFEVRQVGRWVFGPQGGPHTMRVAPGTEARIVEFEAR